MKVSSCSCKCLLQSTVWVGQQQSQGCCSEPVPEACLRSTLLACFVPNLGVVGQVSTWEIMPAALLFANQRTYSTPLTRRNATAIAWLQGIGSYDVAREKSPTCGPMRLSDASKTIHFNPCCIHETCTASFGREHCLYPWINPNKAEQNNRVIVSPM